MTSKLVPKDIIGKLASEELEWELIIYVFQTILTRNKRLTFCANEQVVTPRHTNTVGKVDLLLSYNFEVCRP